MTENESEVPTSNGPDVVIAVKARIRGEVQGVFYRASTLEQAQRLALQGQVENAPDGSVVLIAQGAREKVEALLRYAHHGPESAKVSRVEIETIPVDTARVSFVVQPQH